MRLLRATGHTLFHSIFHHRYASHNMFYMSRLWEKVFFIISFIMQGPSYLVATNLFILDERGCTGSHLAVS